MRNWKAWSRRRCGLRVVRPITRRACRCAITVGWSGCGCGGIFWKTTRSGWRESCCGFPAWRGCWRRMNCCGMCWSSWTRCAQRTCRTGWRMPGSFAKRRRGVRHWGRYWPGCRACGMSFWVPIGPARWRAGCRGWPGGCRSRWRGARWSGIGCRRRWRICGVPRKWSRSWMRSPGWICSCGRLAGRH